MRSTRVSLSLHPALRDRFGLAQTFEQRGAQQKFAGEFRILGGAAKLIVVTLAHRRIALGQEPLVADGLRLRMRYRNMAALPLIAVEHAFIRFAACDRD